MNIYWDIDGTGADTVSEEEYQRNGAERCMDYCKSYCWHYGHGYCDNCAVEKHRVSV